MAASHEASCSLLVDLDRQAPTEKELKELIEKGSTTDRISAVRDMIALTLSGESQTKLIMSVIKYIQPAGTNATSSAQNDPLVHVLKKTVLYFWEVCEKTDAQGNLLPELILVVDALRRDLSHPNEFIRGATLRFLARLRETEILEPLAPTVLDCLVHRQVVVRRNAILALTNIYKRVPDAVPDSHEIIEQLLLQEVDVTAKRNAFLMLFHCVPDRAVEYLRNAMETSDLAKGGDVFQQAIVELLKQLMQTNPHQKSQYIKVIFTLLQSKSEAVLFQCAATLLALSSSPTAIRASATTLVNLLNSNCDTNVKLVVVSKLEEVKKHFPETLVELTMEMLRCLTSTDSEIQKKVLGLSIDLVTAKNVEEVVLFLKKELVESSSAGGKTETEYRHLLIKFLHHATMKHRFVAPAILPILMDFAAARESKPATETISFVREIAHRQPELREDVITKLAFAFESIQNNWVFVTVLWIFGAHSSTYEQIVNVMGTVSRALEPFPLWLPEVEAEAGGAGATAGGGATVSVDGTYIMAVVPEQKQEPAASTSFRSLITGGDFFIASAVSTMLVKLVVTGFKLPIKQSQKESLRTEADKIISELENLGINKGIEYDAHERLRVNKRLLAVPQGKLAQTFVEQSLQSLSNMLDEDDAINNESGKEGDEEKMYVSVDQPLVFTQLMQKMGSDIAVDFVDADVAVKSDAIKSKQKAVKNVVQLTGFSDPIYMEAVVEVHQFDILLDLLLINKTKETLQNVVLELDALGGLKLCERPQVHTLAPGEEKKLRASVKVSSSEAGVVFGNLVYDSGPTDQTVIVLNEIHMDVIDYIHPASCSSSSFKQMWQDFEWENKIVVITEIKDLGEYLDHVRKLTNMRCQAHSAAPSSGSDFLSANLLAKSSFGEPVVANVSISKTSNGIEGYLRIRSRTQGIALALGEKVNMKQSKA